VIQPTIVRRARSKLIAGSAKLAHTQATYASEEMRIVFADDDMVLELAFAAGCPHTVTHNVKDFHGSEQLGVTASTPRDFLNLIRVRT